MSLRTAAGIPISISLEAAALGGKDLGFTPELQEQTEWCWATCLKMVLEKNGDSSKHQCDFANAAYELTGCCLAPSSSLCNSPLPVLQYSQEYNRYGFGANYVGDSISFSAIQFEVNSGNPVQVGIAWNGGGGHAVLITGWDEDGSGDIVIWTNSLDKSINHTNYIELPDHVPPGAMGVDVDWH